MKCGVIEWVKRNSLRWFGHITRMKNEDFVKKVYLSETEGLNRRGRPFEGERDSVGEYIHAPRRPW